MCEITGGTITGRKGARKQWSIIWHWNSTPNPVALWSKQNEAFRVSFRSTRHVFSHDGVHLPCGALNVEDQSPLLELLVNFYENGNFDPSQWPRQDLVSNQNPLVNFLSSVNWGEKGYWGLETIALEWKIRETPREKFRVFDELQLSISNVWVMRELC